MAGYFVISLDFEGLWGSVGTKDPGGFKNRVLKIDEFVPRLLEIFNQYGIHTTWATVGAMLCGSSDEALKYLQKDVFYPKWNLSVSDYFSGISDSRAYFRPDLVKMVADAENQEIGAHTFSHFYALEEGATAELMKQELDACNKIMAEIGVNPKSLVMPRNMVNKDYFSVMRGAGIKAFRGRQNVLFNFNGNKERNKYIDFIDTYIPLRRDLCYSTRDIACYDGLYDIKASMFFRTYSKKFRAFEWLKLARIKKEMKRAAKQGKVFHLWWHPHNMATNLEFNFGTLQKIFDYYLVLSEKYGLISVNMAELADICGKGENK